MRKEWFCWVAKTRKKMVRATKKPVTHRQAMKSAALTWGKEKLKILNRIKREQRKRAKEALSSETAKQKAPSNTE